MRLSISEQSWAGALIGGLMGGAAVATGWNFSPQKDFWDITTSLATVAAVGAALYLSGKESRRRSADSYARASLAAASLTLQLSSMFSDVKRLHDALSEAAKFDCAPAAFTGWHNSITSFEYLSLTDLEPLIPLGNGCASAIAGAQDRLRAVGRLLAGFWFGDGTYESDARKKMANNCAFVLGEALELLDRAASECQKVAMPAIWQK